MEQGDTYLDTRSIQSDAPSTVEAATSIADVDKAAIS